MQGHKVLHKYCLRAPELILFLFQEMSAISSNTRLCYLAKATVLLIRVGRRGESNSGFAVIEYFKIFCEIDTFTFSRTRTGARMNNAF